jgi:peptidase E
MEPDNPLLDDYILSLARRTPPRVCFVPTGSADSPYSLVRFYRAFATKTCVATDLTLFAPAALPRNPPESAQLSDFVMNQDVIYVGGGNTANLLALWRVHGLDAILRAACDAGVVLAGVSAGMNCWFEASVTDSFGPLRELDDGLGFIRGSACPHYDGEPERRPTFQRLIAGGFPAGHAADDGAALHFVDGALAEVVTSRPNAAAYAVDSKSGERKLPSRFLGPP